MISDITLGQFFPGFSIIHKLDPRTKIIVGMLFIIAIFVANTLASLLFLGVLTLVLILISRINFGVIIKGIKPIIFILIFTSLLNIFLTKGLGEPLVEFYFIKIYEEGIFRAFFMSFRVVVLIIGTSMLLTYTTSPISLTDGIENLLKPLKKIGIPVSTFAMMMSIALRFIPTLVEETEKIMNAQKSRGADFSSGGLIKKSKALIPILIPLFLSSFKRADELATAMECRCYRGDVNRSKMIRLSYAPRDGAFITLGVALVSLIIFSRFIPGMIQQDSIFLNILFYKV